jgi:signal transduction histidine kinase
VTDPGGNIVMMNAPAERLFTVPDATARRPSASCRPTTRTFSSFVSNVFFEADARGAVAASAWSIRAPASRCPWRRSPARSSPSTPRSPRWSPSCTTAPRSWSGPVLYEELKKASAELERKVREATAELVHQNELLRRSHIELEQASTLKSQFLANMSHEFRTPLNAILGYTSMLLKGVSGEMTAQQRRNLERIDSNSQHLLSIINDILDISRIEAGKMPLTVVDFTIPELLREVLAEVEPLIARSRLTMSTDWPRTCDGR